MLAVDHVDLSYETDRQVRVADPDFRLALAVGLSHRDLGPPEREQQCDHDGQHDQVRQPGTDTGVAHMDFGRQQNTREQWERPAPPRHVEPLRVLQQAGAPPRGPVLGFRTDCACFVTHTTRVVSPPVSSLQVLLSRTDPDVPLPEYAQLGDAGADLVTTSAVRLEPGERIVIGTGVAIALPEGYAGFVHPRSGLAARVGLSVVNAPGTIDAGYRGEIRVCLVNHDPREPIELARGDRIAQLVVQRVEHAEFVEVESLDPSQRGAGGYGSTGGHTALGAAASAREGTES